MALIRPGIASTIDTWVQTEVIACECLYNLPEQYLCNMPFLQCKDSLTWIQYIWFAFDAADHFVFKEIQVFFSYRVTVVERVTKLLQAVEVLDIVFGLVGCISDPGVQFPPRLDRTNSYCI